MWTDDGDRVIHSDLDNVVTDYNGTQRLSPRIHLLAEMAFFCYKHLDIKNIRKCVILCDLG
ncbi:hypothetical protein J45TS6_08140 [Paenibacillus sp. J45TS6]|nr:hypothetical protein J45TS6_08140 [Paenibacillus sp. J45TS6]